MLNNSSELKKNIRYGWFIFVLTVLFYGYEYLLRVQPSAMSANLTQHYGIDEADFGNLFAIYYYIYTFMQLPVGLLLDKFGTRIALSVACLCCAIGTFLFASSHYLWIAQLGRFLIGLGAAFGFVGVLKIAIIWLPKQYFNMVTGLTQTIAMLGGLLGNNLIAFLMKEIGWRNTTFVFALFGILLTIALWYSLSKKPSVVVNKESEAKNMPTFKGLLGEIFFLLKARQFWLTACIGGLLYTTLSVFAELWGVPYLHEAKHFSNQAAVLIVSMVFLGWAFSAPLVGFFSNYIRNQYVFLFYSCLASALCIALVLYSPGSPGWLIGLFLFFLGAFASTQILIFSIMKKLGEVEMAGSIIALTNTIVMLIGAILQPVVGKIIDLIKENGGVPWLFVGTNHPYQISLTILPLLFLIAAFLAYSGSKKYPATD